MAKKKKSYQFGDPNYPQTKMKEFSGNVPNKDILKFLLSKQGEDIVGQYKKAGYDIQANDNQVNATRTTPRYNLPPAVQAFNLLAQLTTGIANKATDIKNDREEESQYLQALQPLASENFNEQGLNNLPVYTKFGGGSCEHGCGEVDHAMINEMMKSGGWIKGAIKHPGRCSNPGDARCPKGSPQYNLAMRFKHGDLHKSQYGTATNSNFAQDFAQRHNMNEIKNSAWSEGQPKFVDEQGNPFNAPARKSLPITLPNDIQLSDIQRYGNMAWYTDPHTGDIVDVDPSVVNSSRFRKNNVAQPLDMIAKYPYGGGPLTAEGAKEILRDGTVHGKKLTPAQRRYFGYIAGGGSPKSQFGSNINTPAIEAEEGEVYQTPQGQINKIPDSAPSHEQGGVVVNNAERVLENTSDLRKDKKSKALLLSPQLASMLTGIETNKSMSHAAAMDMAHQNIKDNVKDIQNKIKKNVKSLENNKKDFYANNSLDFNLLNLGNQNNPSAIFNNLFEHQEMTKEANGIQNPQVKAQVGIDNAQRLHGTEGWTYLYTRGKRNYYQKQDGSIVSNDGPKMSNEDWRNFLQSESPAHKSQRLANQQGATHYGYTEPVAGIDINYPTAQISDITRGYQPPTFDIPDQTTNNNVATKSRFNFNNTQPKSQFNEPLHWYDVAGPISGLLEGRIPAKYNPAYFDQVRLKLQNPLPALQEGQRDYNDALQTLPQNTQGYANASNLFSKKYGIDNQILGQYENANTQIKNQETMYNAGVRDKQSLSDQQSRAVFEDQRLGSLEAERLQHRTDWDSLMQTLAQNRALNRNGNLTMQLFPAFDQNAQYNGYRLPFRPPLQTPDTNDGLPPDTSILTNNAVAGKPQYFLKTADGKLKPISFK